MSFEAAERIANAVLYEGYLLYPYRASALKNQFRWQFGVLAPRDYAERARTDDWFAQTECLIESDADSIVDIRVRCLQVDGDEGVERTIDRRGLHIHRLLGVEYFEPIRLMRPQGPPTEGVLRTIAEPAGRFVRLRVRIENVTPFDSGNRNRQHMLSSAFVGTHLLMALHGGRFLSLTDPPADAAEATASCANLHTWPVLVGQRESCDMVLSSPVVLYDFPAIAPESQTPLFDATEIDEILALRVLTLTDHEKREARATDPRAAAIVDRIDAMTPGEFESLHGTWRELLNPAGQPSPEDAKVLIGGVTIGRGSRVVIRPRRRADAIDSLLAGRTARVEGVYRDLEDRVMVAVVLDDDPAGAFHAEMGRFFYYGPDELDPD